MIPRTNLNGFSSQTLSSPFSFGARGRSVRSIPADAVTSAPASATLFARPPVYRSVSVSASPPPLYCGENSFFGVSRAYPKDSKTINFAHCSDNIEPDDPLVPSVVPPAPFFLEATHFFSTLRASELKNRVEQVLVESGGSLAEPFDATTCTWQVNRVVQNRRIEMTVQIFSNASNGGPLIVEVARRRGDAFDFDAYYSAVVAKLHASRALCSSTGAIAPAKINSSGPRSPVHRQAVSPVMSVEALAPLLTMLKAPFVDVQSEAARETANLAADARNHDAIVDSGVASRLIELIQSDETDVHRCAVTALSKLVDDARCASMLREKSVLSALGAVASSDACSSHEVGREAAREIVTHLKMRE